jgi:hypothetical protein
MAVCWLHRHIVSHQQPSVFIWPPLSYSEHTNCPPGACFVLACRSAHFTQNVGSRRDDINVLLVFRSLVAFLFSDLAKENPGLVGVCSVVGHSRPHYTNIRGNRGNWYYTEKYSNGQEDPRQHNVITHSNILILIRAGVRS